MYRPEHLTNQPANSNVSTSVLTQLERCQKRQVVLTPDKTSNKLQTEERTTFYHRCNFRMPDSLEGRTLLEEIRSLSVYKNSDRIILPTRRLGSKSKVQCFYCGEWFDNNENGPGSCKEAPDPAERIIRFLTCYSIAQGAIYHCCKDDDDVPANISRFGQGYDVFSFGTDHISLLKRMKRWLFMAVTSLMVPCLCCYFPAHVMNRCFGGGRRGRHKSCHSITNFED